MKDDLIEYASKKVKLHEFVSKFHNLYPSFKALKLHYDAAWYLTASFVIDGIVKEEIVLVYFKKKPLFWYLFAFKLQEGLYELKERSYKYTKKERLSAEWR